MDETPEDLPAYRSPELINLISKMTLEERAQKFFDLCNFSRELQWMGIKMRNKHLSDEEVTEEFKKMMYALYAEEGSQVF